MSWNRRRLASSLLGYVRRLICSRFRSWKKLGAQVNGIVVTIAASAHAGFEVVLVQDGLPLTAGELRAQIGMQRAPIRRLAPPDRLKQGLQGEVRGPPRLGRPADDTAREQLDHDTKVQPTCMGSDVGGDCHPGLVRCRCLAPLLQLVLRHDGWPAAVAPRTAPVDNPGGIPGQ